MANFLLSFLGVIYLLELYFLCLLYITVLVSSLSDLLLKKTELTHCLILKPFSLLLIFNFDNLILADFCLLADWEGESAECEVKTKKMQFLKRPLKMILSCWELVLYGAFRLSHPPPCLLQDSVFQWRMLVLTLPFFPPSFPPSYFFRMKFAYRMKSERFSKLCIPSLCEFVADSV